MVAPEINQLVDEARATPGCLVHDPAGLPEPASGLVLPDDLRDFYSLCGGVDLYTDADFTIRVLSPAEFIPANLAVLGEGDLDDRTDCWYVIATTPQREYISIDLDPARHGRCYDSFPEVHGIVGESKVLANSFTDMLRSLLAGHGGHWYWLEPDFADLGDAYD